MVVGAAWCRTRREASGPAPGAPAYQRTGMSSEVSGHAGGRSVVRTFGKLAIGVSGSMWR